MAPKCRGILLEATNAVKRLTGGDRAATSAGAQSTSAADDDDDVVDATEEYQQAKRQRQAEETIDLDTFKVDPRLVAEENAALQQPMQPGTGKVKVEVKHERIKPEPLA